MIDINLLRDDVDGVASLLKKRGFDLDTTAFLKLEAARKKMQVRTQELQEIRNENSKKIGVEKAKGSNTDSLMKLVSETSNELKALEVELSELQEKINDFLLLIPNIPHFSVPDGITEEDNVVVRECGIKKTFDFKVSDHVDVGKLLGLDFDLGTKLSGSRFVVMRAGIARLHRAISQFMLDIQVNEHGYEECYTPFLVNTESLIGTGQLPKFAEDLFVTKRGNDESDLYLIPTGEVPLTNLVSNSIQEEQHLPLKFTALTPCFRSEAGSYGKDTRGMIRQHQFEKVEMVQISHPDKSYEVLDQMVKHAENILSKLNLPYRVVELCKGDMGFGAAKTYDLEVWIPSQNMYREISSVSNCESFQARRMKARFKDSNKKNTLLHTLNGSGLAVGRTLVAILENNQLEDGSVTIPEVLMSYMGGEKTLKLPR
jgi:seryl-tRNA synthetase